LTRFSDGEIYFRSMKTFAAPMFSSCSQLHARRFELMELFLMIDAFRAGVGAANHGGDAVLRLRAAGSQDKPRVPISSKVVSDLLVASGTHRLLAMDLHAPQIRDFSAFL
jgi:ribose-phosphate pyrophosphokinase